MHGLRVRVLLLMGIVIVNGVAFVQTASSLATPASGPPVTLPPCSDSALYGVPASRQITLPWKGHPRLLVRVYCEPGPHWYVSETIGQARPLIYQQPPATVPVNSPVGVVSFFSYASKALPVALIETSLGASARTYELFADLNHKLRVLNPPGLLAGTNAFLHGEGISCTAVPKGELTVTQTTWDVANTGNPTKNSEVTVHTERWVLGGAVLHEVSSTVLPDRTTTYGATPSLGDVRC